MTTIAADRRAGVMCSDSRWTSGDECGTIRKVFRVRGDLLGFAGSLVDWKAWLEAYRAGGKLPTENVNVLRLGPAGLASWDNTNGWTDIEEPTFAVGTGGAIARALMLAGVPCRRAIAITEQVDPKTAGRVREYRL